jgi:hypothetical protein
MGIPSWRCVELDDFLTGECTLPSDALDRLAAAISFEVCRSA